jgi:type IV pilus assembly protein PilY1
MRFVPLNARLTLAAILLAVGVLTISGSTAQSTAPLPTVDLRLGPVATTSQAVNIALALSVEFPTVGAAYRNAAYNEATTYLGYFDPKGCYNYKDITADAPLIGEYFYRTGTVTTDGYCNYDGSLGRFSGNALNYITTSSIDLLRYALTGGNRVVDTASTTILERAYLYNGWNLHNGYFPAKRIPQALVGKVIPPLVTNADVYAGGCKDKVWFGTANTAVACDTAGTTTSGNLNPTQTTGTVVTTQTVEVPAGAAAPTNGTLIESGVWVISSPLETTTTLPSAGPVTYTDTPVETGGETTSAPPAPITNAQAFIRNSYVANGNTSTTAPASPIPTTIVSTTDVSFSTRYFIYPSPPTSGAYRTFSFSNNNLNVCRTSNNTTPTGFKGLLNSSGTPTGVSTTSCGSGAYSSYSSRGKVSNTTRTVYEPLNTINIYALYDTVPIYKEYTMQRNYDVYYQVDRYTVPVTTTQTVTTSGTMFARVRVCDDSESTTRTDLCTRYPDGNYKPVGEIQRNAASTRVSAFGYLAQDGTSRYGGVLRAPMKYPGPSYIDPAGQTQVNAQAEWSANNGVFTTNPLGDTEFGVSGVINYLNKFGTTGTLGYYKGNDPVGELYYEALRYFQGKQPTSSATSGMTTAMKDGFPVQTTWSDPVLNACSRRNFILTIGDVNTWYDKQLPGHKSPNGVNETTIDPARAVEPIPGSSTLTFNAQAWTDLLSGFETNTSKSYTDAQGRAQTTLGNPNPVSGNSSLATTATGAGSSSAYYWAGAAYWANTQSIRLDSDSSGASMKDVRVKTFTIDVDEGGNGLIDGNTRGIKPRNSSFYLAGKYGWFNDSNLDGNPFKASGGVTNNSEWEDASTPNTPDGYVIASQASKMISGIRKFFSAATSQRGSVSVSAVSTSRFTASTLNGDFFAPQFNPGDWSGTVQKSSLRLNTTTGTVESTPGVVWDSGQILSQASTMTATATDPFIKPADRNIITLSTDAVPTGVRFDVAHKGLLDAVVGTNLNTDPATSASDGLIDGRINWLRGSHSLEQSSTGGTFRRRTNIMGDIINSGPVYKQSADPNISGPGYGAFASSVASRPAMIYVGANDGMMHGFRASDGKELLAYIPRAIAPNLNKLTNPNYTHIPFADGIPQISEANLQGTWKTVLVSGMGGGAQGVFAIDVTHPESFGTSNVLFEFTDADDSDMGNVTMQPQIVKLRMTSGAYKWFVVVGSGYNNYQIDGHQSTSGAQAMFFLSLDKPVADAWSLGTNYYKVVLPVSSTSMANGLMNPGYAKGPAGEATLLYAGDLQGNVWKIDLTSGFSSSALGDSILKTSGVYKPLFTATAGDTANARQPITTTPQVVEANSEGYMVVFGTGKFVEPDDTSTSGLQAIYGVWDSMETTAADMTVPRNKLFARTATLSGSTVTLSTDIFTYGTSNSTTSGTYRGWYINLPSTRERISVESALGIGIVSFRSTIPEGSCSGDGSQRAYCLNPVYGNSLGCDMTANSGNPSAPKIFQIALDQSYSTSKPTGSRTVTVDQQMVGSSTKITDAGNVMVYGQNVNSVTLPAGRVSWRELR